MNVVYIMERSLIGFWLDSILRIKIITDTEKGFCNSGSSKLNHLH
jgi:hypothetical protein